MTTKLFHLYLLIVFVGSLNLTNSIVNQLNKLTASQAVASVLKGKK